jgi:hypothetical protein
VFVPVFALLLVLVLVLLVLLVFVLSMVLVFVAVPVLVLSPLVTVLVLVLVLVFLFLFWAFLATAGSWASSGSSPPATGMVARRRNSPRRVPVLERDLAKVSKRSGSMGHLPAPDWSRSEVIAS